jgi:hypothetical protein
MAPPATFITDKNIMVQQPSETKKTVFAPKKVAEYETV